ncbi:MAG: Planctomycete cytochrome [Bryobacterales bacterium]|nr:Planctomycete cytochrome [Bryobacterales bacterium]
MVPDSLVQRGPKWNSILNRVRNSEMPPRGAPAPPSEQREAFTTWLHEALKKEACSTGISAGAAPIRRLNRAEYSSTVRDLLNVQMDIGAGLPMDGAGGEGFDNAAETLFLSPVHAEKYLDAAKTALEFAAKDPRSRAKFMISTPRPGVTPREAAREILTAFLPRAFRRPVDDADLQVYLGLFDIAQKGKATFDDSVLYALKGVLVSPQFLFRSEDPNPNPQPRPLDDYALATRLSYFLWGTTPDSLLLVLAKAGKLHDPEILQGQVARMLRNQRSFDFVQSFVEQWLGTRALGQTVQPDAKLFPAYAGDEELRGDVRYQPVLFFREILANDLSLLNLIDSKFTITTKKLQKLYGLSIDPPRKDRGSQPQRIELPEGTHRGGLLGMSAILAVSSHPQRTSPVLRGKWILDAMLGTPPPPPPPDVPALEEPTGPAPRTVRELLSQHRANPVCASCHSRIDPLGFALENYDAIGRWRDQESGKPVDAKGTLPDGTAFEGPDQLKTVLMARKDVFIRNLTNKMLGYALGRGLTLKDSCVVDTIVADVQNHDYRAGALINAVVMSVPFRYQVESTRAKVVTK